jgi:hypothetical protein
MEVMFFRVETHIEEIGKKVKEMDMENKFGLVIYIQKS